MCYPANGHPFHTLAVSCLHHHPPLGRPHLKPLPYPPAHAPSWGPTCMLPSLLPYSQAKVPKDAQVVVACQKGLRSLAAAEQLR